MTSSIVNIIKTIDDSQSAKVRLSFTNMESAYLDCVYKESEAPSFFLVFSPGTIPDNLDFQSNCSVSINKKHSPIVISAKIEALRGDRTLELVATEIIDPVSLREYFRVFYKTPITASHRPSSGESIKSLWKVKGTTMDLSASGVLAIFPQEFEHNEHIFLEFNLIGNNRSIQCLSHVVRVRHIRKSRCQIALHFDQIPPNDQDAIVTECMGEQRRQLRKRMQGE